MIFTKKNGFKLILLSRSALAGQSLPAINKCFICFFKIFGRFVFGIIKVKGSTRLNFEILTRKTAIKLKNVR